MRKNLLKKTMAVLTFALATLGTTFTINAKQEIHTSTHTFSSYSTNVEVGYTGVNYAKDWIKFINEHEGIAEKIEGNAYFYKTYDGELQKPLPAITVSSGKATIGEITNGSGNVDAISIRDLGLGFNRLKGTFQWTDKLSNPSLPAPTKIKRYPFQVDIYSHVKATGMKITSNAVNDSDSIDYYCYEGDKDTVKVAVLPFNKDFVKWDKVGNNAIQYFTLGNSQTNIVNASSKDDDWDEGSVSFEALETGYSKVTLTSKYNKDATRAFNFKVYKKPSFSINYNEIDLANNVSLQPLKALSENLGENPKNNVTYKWSSSNPDIVEITNDTSPTPTIKTKAIGTAKLTCTFNDQVTTNNKTKEPVSKNVTVNVKKDSELKTNVVTSNGTYIKNGDTITSSKEGDEVFVRVEENNEEAALSYKSSNEKVATTKKATRSGYSFSIQKVSAGTAEITCMARNGKKITFKYVAEKSLSDIVDPYSNIKPSKPKFKLSYKKHKLTIKIKKKPSAYKAKGFEIKIKRGKKTVIKTKWKKCTLKIKNLKKAKYTVYVRAYNGTKKSAWAKKKKKIKK